MLRAKPPERHSKTDRTSLSHSMVFRHQRASPQSHRRRLSRLPSNSVRRVSQTLSPFLTVQPTLLATSGSVIKAQVLAGGRGKGRFDTGLQGGVHKVNRCVLPPPWRTLQPFQFMSTAPNMLRNLPSRCLAQISSPSRPALEGGFATLYVALRT